MKHFYVKGFEGHYPVGTAAVVSAPSRRRARQLVNVQLANHGLPPLKPTDVLVEMRNDSERAAVLLDGDY